MDTQLILKRINEELNDSQLYTASTLAMLARAKGIIDDSNGKQMHAETQRVRTILLRMADIGCFSPTGDGMLECDSAPIGLVLEGKVTQPLPGDEIQAGLDLFR